MLRPVREPLQLVLLAAERPAQTGAGPKPAAQPGPVPCGPVTADAMRRRRRWHLLEGARAEAVDHGVETRQQGRLEFLPGGGRGSFGEGARQGRCVGGRVDGSERVGK